MPLKVIIPRKILAEPQKLARAVENALDGAARAAKVDFGVTVQTWTNKPDFEISASPGERTIGTDDEVYGYVNDGTRPHVIQAKPGKMLAFGTPTSPKTAVRVIGSSAGSRGSNRVYTQRVNHPGTEAREFDEVIAEKWREQLPVTLQRAVDSEVQ